MNPPFNNQLINASYGFQPSHFQHTGSFPNHEFSFVPTRAHNTPARINALRRNLHTLIDSLDVLPPIDSWPQGANIWREILLSHQNHRRERYRLSSFLLQNGVPPEYIVKILAYWYRWGVRWMDRNTEDDIRDIFRKMMSPYDSPAIRNLYMVRVFIINAGLPL